MEESNTLENNATKQCTQKGDLSQGEVLSCIKVKHMKESNTLAGNATMKQLQSHLLLGTELKSMKE